MLLNGFLEFAADVIRRGLNSAEPEGRPVPGRELLPMRHNMVIPPRKWVGRHRRHDSMVAEDVAHIDEKDRSSLPLRSLAWLQGVKR